MTNHGYEIHNFYMCIDAYKFPDNLEAWLDCCYCGLKPKVWEFDNGRSTACGCFKNEYDHFSIHAESIMSVYHNTGSTKYYSSKALLENWNTFVRYEIFKFVKPRDDGRW